MTLDSAIRCFMTLPDAMQVLCAFIAVCSVWFGAMVAADKLAGSIRLGRFI